MLEDAARNNIQRTHSRVNVAMRDQDAYIEDKDGHEYAHKYHHYQPHRQHETVEYHHAPAEQQHVVHYSLYQASHMGKFVWLICITHQRAPSNNHCLSTDTAAAASAILLQPLAGRGTYV